MAGTGRRKSRYDIGIVEHELVPDDGKAAPIAMPPSSMGPPQAPGAAGAGVQAMLDTMHRELESVLRAEMRAVEVAIGAHTRDLEAQLRTVQAEIERVQAETRALQDHPVHAMHEAARSRLGVPG